MRVFVFEYVTGGGLAGRPMVSGLAGEGDLMLKSLVRDLVQIWQRACLEEFYSIVYHHTSYIR